MPVVNISIVGVSQIGLTNSSIAAHVNNEISYFLQQICERYDGDVM